MRVPAFNQIRWKLTILIMGICAVVVALGGLAVVTYDAFSSRQHLVGRVETIAEITAANSSAALAMKVEWDARDVLAPLIQRQDIDFAGLLYNDGTPFVRVTNNAVGADLKLPPFKAAESQVFRGSQLILQRAVIFDGRPEGFILVVANLIEESARSRAFLLITSLAMGGLVGVALLLGTRLQRLVSDPIAQLATAARAIRRNKDYSIRAPKNSEDEVGELVEAFNEMLAEIERQNRSVTESETRLKLALTASRMGLWEWELRSDKIRCSDETRAIFGCPTSEATMAMFSQLLHPEDADHVMKSLRAASADASLFACEYRVITPANKLVWVLHVGRIQTAPDGTALLAGIVQDVTFRKQAEGERQKLVANLLHAEEEERRRIARELHDTTAQHLAALKMNCVRIFETSHEQTLANQSRQLLDQALLELRTLTYVLHPPVLEEFGLAGALADFAAGIGRRNGIKITVDARQYVDRAPATVELALFRVVQESVTNAVRHSGTSQIQVELARNAEETQLTVRDFGRGLTQPVGSLQHSGVGIGSMKERMALIGGELSVESSGKGVTVVASVRSGTEARPQGANNT